MNKKMNKKYKIKMNKEWKELKSEIEKTNTK